MGLTYIPLSINKCCEFLNIPDTKYVNKYIYDKFIDFYNDNFCTFGINKKNGEIIMCGNRIKNGNIYCNKHLQINIKKEVKQKNYCAGKSRRNKYGCGRIVNNYGDLCCFHKNNKKNVVEPKIKNINYIIDTNKFYFKRYKEYLYSLDIYDDIIYEIYSNEYTEYKQYLNDINYYDDNIIYEKYKFKDEIINIVNCSFNTNSLYTIIDNIKIKHENIGTNYYNHIINKEQIISTLINIPNLMYTPKNMQLIQYNKYGKETIDRYIKDRIKRYVKNKKKKNKNVILENNKKEEKNKIIHVKNDIKLNPLIIKDILEFIEKYDNFDNFKYLMDFLKQIKNSKYLEFYGNFIKTNIYKILDLNSITKINTNELKYKKIIIFNKFNKEKNKENNINYIFQEIIYELDEIPQNNISWFGNISSIYDYTNKYSIDIVKDGINIYKKNDIKKNKLNTNQLHIFYC